MSASGNGVARRDDALSRVIAFARTFGSNYAALCMHASVPLGLTPRLLHLLRFNFLPEVPRIAEADILLSPLCRDVGGGFFQFDPMVRDLLLFELMDDPEFGRTRVSQIADLMLGYVEHELRFDDHLENRSFLLAQKWTALAYTDPALAARELAEAIRGEMGGAYETELLRITSITERLSAPLYEHEEMLLYTAGLDRLTRGNVDAAVRFFQSSGHMNEAMSVAGVVLPDAQTLIEEKLGPNQAGQGSGEEDEFEDTLERSRIFDDDVPWPSVDEFQVAIREQSETLFGSNHVFDTRIDGPIVYRGAFSAVYKATFQSGASDQQPERLAIRLFTKPRRELMTRYPTVLKYLAENPIAAMASDIVFWNNLRINGHAYPFVSMEWIDGEPLHQVVFNLCRESMESSLGQLVQGWSDLCAYLEQRSIAHGDLQHNNILVDSSLRIRLIDYDSMVVPGLVGEQQIEIGMPPYQHPKRQRMPMSTQLDRFGQLLIYVTLRVLEISTDHYPAGGASRMVQAPTTMLFSQNDLVNPESSQICRKLLTDDNPEVQLLTANLLDAYQGSFEDVPALADFRENVGNLLAASLSNKETVFVSFAAEDRAIVPQILSRAFSVRETFMARNQTQLLDQLIVERSRPRNLARIQDSIENCSVFILCHSRSSSKSEDVRRELDAARSLLRSTSKFIILQWQDDAPQLKGFEQYQTEFVHYSRGSEFAVYFDSKYTIEWQRLNRQEVSFLLDCDESLLAQRMSAEKIDTDSTQWPHQIDGDDILSMFPTLYSENRWALLSYSDAAEFPEVRTARGYSRTIAQALKPFGINRLLDEMDYMQQPAHVKRFGIELASVVFIAVEQSTIVSSWAVNLLRGIAQTRRGFESFSPRPILISEDGTRPRVPSSLGDTPGIESYLNQLDCIDIDQSGSKSVQELTVAIERSIGNQPDNDQLSIGSDNYVLLRKLRERGATTDYLVRDKTTDVELLMTRPNERWNSDNMRPFEEVQQTITSLGNVTGKRSQFVAIQTLGSINNDSRLPFATRALVDGVTLVDHLNEKVGAILPQDWILGTLIVLAEGLEVMHEDGLIHGGLRPELVIITPGGFPILEFDWERIFLQPFKHATPFERMAYMSPEQVRGEQHRIDARTDIWAFGLLAYQLANGGAHPFGVGEGDTKSLADAIVRRPLPETSSRDEGVLQLQRVWQGCLEKLQSDRYLEMGDIVHDLKEIRDSLAKQPGKEDVGGPIVILSDIHGNLEALTAVMDDIAGQGITRIFCLGNVIGFGPNPLEVLNIAMDKFEVTLLGPFENAALFDTEGWDSIAERAAYWNRAQLESGNQQSVDRYWEFLGSLPRSWKLNSDTLLVHGSPRNPTNESVYPEDIYNERKMEGLFAFLQNRGFIGRTAVPGVFTQGMRFLSSNELPHDGFDAADQKSMVSVGGVGLSGDGDPRACYAIFNEGKISFRRVDYDIKTTIAKMKQLIPDFYEAIAAWMLDGQYQLPPGEQPLGADVQDWIDPESIDYQPPGLSKTLSIDFDGESLKFILDTVSQAIDCEILNSGTYFLEGDQKEVFSYPVQSVPARSVLDLVLSPLDQTWNYGGESNRIDIVSSSTKSTSGSIAILGDIHANLDALDAVLADVRSQKISRIICVGNTVGVGAMPEACLQIAMGFEKTLRGYCDSQSLRRENLSDLGFDEDLEEHLGPVLARSLYWTRDAVSNSQFGNPHIADRRRKFLRGTPVVLHASPFVLSHGGTQATGRFQPREHMEYLLESANLEDRQRIEGSRLIVAGNGAPGIYEQSGRFEIASHDVVPVERLNNNDIIATGSVGWPGDGDDRASYLVLSSAGIQFRRVVYDVDRAVARIRAIPVIAAQEILDDLKSGTRHNN
ncbi:MAG: protein kinase [Planctomycetota bacterium]